MPRRRRLDRRQVIEAAIAVTEAEGPQALGINRVARALGIKPPSLYNHVANGNDLAWGVVIEANRRLLAHVRAVPVHGTDPQTRVIRLAETLRAWAMDNLSLYTVMAQTPVNNDDPEFAVLMDEMMPLFGHPLKELGLTGDAVIHAMRTMRSAVHGFVLLESSEQFGLSQPVDDSFQWLVTALVRGFAAGPLRD